MYVKELDLFVTVMLLEETHAVLLLGKLCEDHGYSYHWTSGHKPPLIKNGRRTECNTANYVPIVVPGLSTSSSSSSSPSSSTHKTAIPTEHTALIRCESMSDGVRGDSSRKNDNEVVRRDPLRDLPGWLEEFTENLVDGSVQEHRDAPSSSRELSPEPRAKVVPGKHSIFTPFSKVRNGDICLRTTITWGSLQKTHWYSRATDHKIVSEESESRNNHRYAVVVQDLATQWIQSYPC